MSNLDPLRCILAGLVAALAVSACSEDAKPVRGFVLPEGDIARGEQVFVAYQCHGCHTIPGIEFPATDYTPRLMLEIGGEVYNVNNYGELLTSVVNPDHVISTKYKALLERAERAPLVSPMPDFGERMSVAELIDLVAFLHAQYSRLQLPYDRDYYLIR